MGKEMTRAILFFALGVLVYVSLLQLYILATREPFVVRCDGGEERETE